MNQVVSCRPSFEVWICWCGAVGSAIGVHSTRQQQKVLEPHNSTIYFVAYLFSTTNHIYIYRHSSSETCEARWANWVGPRQLRWCDTHWRVLERVAHRKTGQHIFFIWLETLEAKTISQPWCTRQLNQRRQLVWTILFQMNFALGNWSKKSVQGAQQWLAPSRKVSWDRSQLSVHMSLSKLS